MPRGRSTDLHKHKERNEAGKSCKIMPLIFVSRQPHLQLNSAVGQREAKELHDATYQPRENVTSHPPSAGMHDELE